MGTGNDVRHVEESANRIAPNSVSHRKDHVGFAAGGFPKDCVCLFASLEGAGEEVAAVEAAVIG